MAKVKEKLERIFEFFPAYDKRNPNPEKDFGIGHVRGMMVLKGKKGAVHFSFSTGILLESTMREYIKTGRAKYEMLSTDNEFYLNKPMGYDVGYHSRKPLHKGQEINWPTKMVKPKGFDPKNIESFSKVKFRKIGKKPPVCKYLGAPCYCDGSALRAESFMTAFIEKGSEEVWKMLEEEYRINFESTSGK